MKSFRVLALVREGLVPPESMEGYSEKEIDEWKMEYDVVTTLRELGHEALPVGVYDDLGPIRKAMKEWRPDITFMLLEEFYGLAAYDQAVTNYIELLRQPYTGCNPMGLVLSRDKALCKKILKYHRIRTPRFTVFPKGRKARRPARLGFPLFVKSAMEDASLGISQASVVRDDAALAERVEFIHHHTGSDALAEEYIEGREIYVGVMGNLRLQTFSPWEILFKRLPEDVSPIATAKVKWDAKYREKYGIETRAADHLTPRMKSAIEKMCKRVYRLLNMSGYARMDIRMREDGQLFFLEANANPNLSFGEDFAESAEHCGIEYNALIQRILALGFRYKAPWQNI